MRGEGKRMKGAKLIGHSLDLNGQRLSVTWRCAGSGYKEWQEKKSRFEGVRSWVT